MDVPSASDSSSSHEQRKHEADADTRGRIRARRGSESKTKTRSQERDNDNSYRPSPSHDNSNLRNIFDTTPPSTQRSSSNHQHNKQSADRATSQPLSARGKRRSSSSHHSRSTSRELEHSPHASVTRPDRHETVLSTSPIQPNSSSSSKRKKRSWSSLPSPTDHHGGDEERQSKRDRGGIFRIDATGTPPSKPAEPDREWERPGPTLSYNMEELGLQPNAGTPNSETGVSPVTLALRDIMWDPLAIDSKDHQQRNSSRRKEGSPRRVESGQQRPQQEARIPRQNVLFSPSDDSTSTRQSSASGDRVALDFGIKVSTPDADE
jgi:hypothetical protein